MNDTTYEAGTFKDIYSLPIGKEIWNFLNSDKIWDKLEITTYLGHPAAEGIGDNLLEEFPVYFAENAVNRDRLKQTVGHMIRQIMEANGYILVQKSVKCRINKLFNVASRYRKKE